MLFRLSWRNIWRNGRRSMITIASVSFAVIFAVFLQSLKEGQYNRMLNNLVGNFSGYIQVHSSGFWSDPVLDNAMTNGDSLASSLRTFDGILEIVPRLETSGLAAAGDRTKFVTMIGTDPGKEKYLTALHNRLISGEYLRQDDGGALIGSGLAEYMELKIGDTIFFTGPGYHGATAWGRFPIIGIVRLGSPDFNKRVIFIPLKQAEWATDARDAATALVVIPAEESNIPELASRLKKSLEPSFEVMTWDEMNPMILMGIESDRAEGKILSGILYIVIAFGIFGTVVMMMAERKHEFGVLASIGMTRWRLGLVVSLELIMISLLSAIAGMAASLPVVCWFHLHPIPLGEKMVRVMEEYGFEGVLQTAMDPAIFFEQTFFVFVLTSLIGTFPFWKLKTLKPVEAMR